MMRKILLIWCFAFSALSVWADVFRPDSSSWVTVELHDRDTITLDSAALYKFNQLTDTVRDVVIRCKSPRSSDTIFSSLDITGANIINLIFSVNARCNVRIQGDAVFSGTSSVGLTKCEVHIDVDTLPDIGCSDVKLNIDRGAISTITGGYCRIGENMSGRISIRNITHSAKPSYLFNGEVNTITYPNQFIQEGGKVLDKYYNVGGTRNDTVIIINGGEVNTITKNAAAKTVVNGGVVHDIKIWNGHPGNVILNGGVVTNSVWWQAPNNNGLRKDTIFLNNHAIIALKGTGAVTLSNKEHELRLDDIRSLSTIKCGRTPIFIYENKATGDTILRTTFDSLPNWDVITIYPSYQRIIHYQVADGIAPKDSTYQEGIVRYFTTIPTRTDYDFMGWYADSLCTIRVDSLDEWSRGDTTLWALWDPIPVRLAYETFGVQLSNQKDLRTHHSEQQQFAIPDALPELPFYTFHGWHADSLTGPVVSHTADIPLLDMEYHILYGEFTREIPSLSIMIAQENCLAVRNPEGHSELTTAHYTWVHQDTIDVNGVDSIISDTLPSNKMYIEVGSPIPSGRYISIIHVDEEWPIYVTRYFPTIDMPSSCSRNSNTHTLFYIGSYILEIDEERHKYLIMP